MEQKSQNYWNFWETSQIFNQKLNRKPSFYTTSYRDFWNLFFSILALGNNIIFLQQFFPISVGFLWSSACAYEFIPLNKLNISGFSLLPPSSFFLQFFIHYYSLAILASLSKAQAHVTNLSMTNPLIHCANMYTCLLKMIKNHLNTVCEFL